LVRQVDSSNAGAASWNREFSAWTSLLVKNPEAKLRSEEDDDLSGSLSLSRG
jgi:hypothetical protein